MSVLQISTDNGVRVLTLNRPERLNAINDELSTQLEVAIAEASADDNVRVIMLTGNGKGFSSGLDLADLSNQESPANPRAAQLDDLEWVGRLALAIAHNDKPVIAAINGIAAGAGFALTLACDLRFMSESAMVTSGYIRRGLNPDAGMTYFLPRLIGQTRATELILTGRDVTASEAKQIGLINDAFPDDEFQEQAMDFAKQLAAGPPIAMTLSKRLLVASQENDLTTSLKQELASIKTCFGTDDVAEGMIAFSEKRKPQFKGN